MWLAVVRGMSIKEIASVLYMSETSVHRYLSLFHSTGCVTPMTHTGRPSKILDEFEQLTVLQTLIHSPTSYLHEVQEHLHQATGKWVSVSTLCLTIRQNEFTRKKVEAIAVQRSEEKRVELWQRTHCSSLKCSSGLMRLVQIEEKVYEVVVTTSKLPVICTGYTYLCHTCHDNLWDRGCLYNYRKCK